jgi:sulfite reductase (ferredoxin)
MHDHIGWEAQGDDRWYYGLNVENGRIADNETVRLKTAVREICQRLDPGIRLTAHQSLGFTDIAETDRSTLEEILERHGVTRSEQVSTVRRWSMACVALPTCGLAITDSERALPGIMDQLESALAELGLENEKFLVRMTGCPNGCARPYNCDIGLVGKAKGRYTVLLGGSSQGTRLNSIYKDLVPTEEIVPTLVPLLTYFQQERQPGESFGDFCHRQGVEDLTSHA